MNILDRFYCSDSPRVFDSVRYLRDFERAAVRMYSPEEPLPVKFALINAETDEDFMKNVLDHDGSYPTVVMYRKTVPVKYPGYRRKFN